jgi:hypothetical protein
MSVRAERETDVVRAVLTYLRVVRRWPAWRNNSGAVRLGKRFIRFGEVGSADVLAVIPPAGRLLAVEAKAGGNRTTPAQAAWLQLVTDAGGLALVVRSVDDLAEQLRQAGYP